MNLERRPTRRRLLGAVALAEMLVRRVYGRRRAVTRAAGGRGPAKPGHAAKSYQ